MRRSKPDFVTNRGEQQEELRILVVGEIERNLILLPYLGDNKIGQGVKKCWGSKQIFQGIKKIFGREVNIWSEGLNTN